jgi:ATP-binding cassette subfamily B protein/subfamily B ATP-binding cassette protein MsbA
MMQQLSRWRLEWFSGPIREDRVAEHARREEKVRGLLRSDDEQLGRVYDERLMRRLIGYIRPYARELVIAVTFMIVSSLLLVAGPWIIGQAIDQGIDAGNYDALYAWSVLFLVVIVLETFTNRTRIYLMAKVGTHVVARIRRDLYLHLHSQPLDFHNQTSVGRLISRLVSDVDVLLEFVTWTITGLARAIFILAGITVVMLLMSWQLALVTFAVLPLMVLLTNFWRSRVRTTYRATRQRISLINGYLNESITGIRVTKSFAREEPNARHFDDLNHSYLDANLAAAWLTALYFPGIDFLGSLAAALVLAVGGWLVFGDALSAGVLVAFMIYVERFFDPIRELAQRYNSFQSTMAASERIFGLLDTAPTMRDAPDAVKLPAVDGRVDFENVSFSYKPDDPVLKGVTLHAEPGERVALVGETGAGKSTVIRLLARFFDVTDGAVKIDGYDVRSVTMASLRRQLGIVLQDTFLFTGTIADNIRYGRLDASDEMVEQAARAVGAHDFIMQQPQGYGADVGENGLNLSVGQRQIISFARALLADPRILILDEATSSVDTATEKIIGQALDELMKGRTSFVIAHRLSTIVNADKIVVMDKGEIVEMGTHGELLDQRGRYFQLYTMQWAQQGLRGNV